MGKLRRLSAVALGAFGVLAVGAPVASAQGLDVFPVINSIVFGGLGPNGDGVLEAAGSGAQVTITYNCSEVTDSLGLQSDVPGVLQERHIDVELRQSHTQVSELTSATESIPDAQVICDGTDHTAAMTMLADGPGFTVGSASITVFMTVCTADICSTDRTGGSMNFSGDGYDPTSTTAPRAIRTVKSHRHKAKSRRSHRSR